MDYGFEIEGRIFTPNATSGISLTENEARNEALEAAQLAEWVNAPEYACFYVTRTELRTWLGTVVGHLVKSTTYRNNLGATIRCVTFKATNGSTYHGRFGSDWGNLVRLHRSK